MGLTCDTTVRVTACTLSDALAERLKRMLLRWACSECIRLSFERTEQLLPLKNEGAQLLFLDIDSIELPEQGRPGRAGLIVISRDAGRVLHSYRWHPAAFLKPDCDLRRLTEALAACEKHWRDARVCLDSPYQRRGFRIPLGRVRYVEASAHYAMFSQARQAVRVRYAISELEALLPDPPFVRCHRSYLVHLNNVADMSYTSLTLKDGTTLPLGRTYVKSLQYALQSWREEETTHDDLDL